MKTIDTIPVDAAHYEKPETEKITSFLEARVVGQKEALERATKQLAIIFSGIKIEATAPLGSLLFIGPSGVGKTETALGVVAYLLDQTDLPEEERNPEKFLLKINCGEYALEQSASTLTGSPTGYVGSKATTTTGGVSSYIPPALGSEAIEKHKITLKDGSQMTVVLMDEIEKAHINVRNFILGALDKGMAKNAANEDVNFRNTLFIFTSNLGNAELALARSHGEILSPEKIESTRRDALMETFRPEDVGRMAGGANEAVVFKELDRESSKKILGIQLTLLEKQLLKSGIGPEFQMTTKAQERLLDIGIDPDTGARKLKAVLRRNIYETLIHPSKEVTMKALNGQTIFIDFEADEFLFYTKENPSVLAKEIIPPIPKTKSEAKDGGPSVEIAEGSNIRIEYAPGTKEKMEELGIILNPQTQEMKFTNFDIMNPVFFDGYKLIQVLMPKDGQGLNFIMTDESGEMTAYRANSSGLPVDIQFNMEGVKKTRTPSYIWKGKSVNI